MRRNPSARVQRYRLVLSWATRDQSGHLTLPRMTTVSGIKGGRSTGNALPPNCVIQVHVAELKQLFNSIDPSPFRNKDLYSKTEEFKVE
jgi:hypothetical protein